MYLHQITNWTLFLSVAAAVAATLTGLIFVAIPINLSPILEHHALSNRAAESIVQLVAAVVIPLIALVPVQSLAWLETQLTLRGVILWLVQTRLQRVAFDQRSQAAPNHFDIGLAGRRDPFRGRWRLHMDTVFSADSAGWCPRSSFR